MRSVCEVDRGRVKMRPDMRGGCNIESVHYATKRKQAPRDSTPDAGTATRDDDLQPSDRAAIQDLTR